MKLATALTALLTLGFAAASPAAVVGENTDLLVTSGNTPHTDTFSFDASTNTVFLVAITYEAGAQTTGVTLDPTGANIGLTKLVESNFNSSIYTAIYGVNLGTVAAGNLDYTLTTTSSLKNSISAIQLSNATLAGIQTDVDGTSNSVTNPLTADFTGLASGSTVVTVVAARKAGIAFSVGGTPAETSSIASGAQNHHQGISYTTGVAGGLTRTWTGDDSTDDTSLSAVAIAVVPEPASLALLGLGGLCILGGRGRRA